MSVLKEKNQKLMQDDKDKKLDFVIKHYEEGRYDPEKAIKKFHARVGDKHKSSRRWWTSAAAVFAAAFVLFAGGYGVFNIVKGKPSAKVETADPEPEKQIHIFEFDNVRLAEVLKELSDYYGCTLTAPETDKCLSASFPEDDLDVIVSAIESALEVEITIE